jgi:tetratricopeptide (TPR) repeat protein
LKPSPKRDAADSKWPFRAGLLLITLAAYSNSFGLGLVQDSAYIVARDSRIREATAADVSLILGTHYWWPMPSGNLYRPLTTLSLLFNYAVLGNGPNPLGYHIVNFLLHVIDVWLVFELALLVLRRKWPAFFTAALWGIHPAGVESVVNVVGRADLLAAMATLAGVLLYARTASKTGWHRTIPALALCAIAIAGVLSKESAAVLIGLMLLWDISFSTPLPRGRGSDANLKHRLVQSWPYYLAVTVSLVLLAWVRHAVLSGLPAIPQYMSDNPLFGANFWTARFTAIQVIGLDLQLLLVPLHLSADRSYNQIPLATLADPGFWLALLAVAAIIAVALMRYRQDCIWFWFAGFFGIALLPTSNLIFPIGALMAERFLYLPAVPLTMALVALLFRLSSPRLTTGILAAVGLLFMARTVARNPVWNTDLTLATADLESAPNSARLHDMLALALFIQDAPHNIDRIIAEQAKSWQILSSLPPERSSDRPLAYLGIYYLFKADLAPSAEHAYWRERALTSLVQARAISRAAEKAYDDDQRAHGRPLEVRIPFALLYFTLGDIYRELGHYPEAIETLRYGRGVDPQALRAYDGLSAAYLGMGDMKLAAVSLEQKALLDGSQPQTLAALAEVYRKIPDAACAFLKRGASWQLNPGCARVKSDICLAYADLVRAWEDGRQPDKAREFTGAAQRLGCGL